MRFEKWYTRPLELNEDFDDYLDNMMDLKKLLEIQACRFSIKITSLIDIECEKLLHHYVLTFQVSS